MSSRCLPAALTVLLAFPVIQAPALAQFNNNTAGIGRGEPMSHAERREAQARCDALAPGSAARNRCIDDLVLNRNEAARNARDVQRASGASRDGGAADPRLRDPAAAGRADSSPRSGVPATGPALR